MSLRPQHPRLVFTPELEIDFHRRLKIDPLLREVVAGLRTYSDASAEEPTVPLVKVPFAEFGYQMLETSRHVLMRVATHAFLYRITGEAVYVDRTWRELESALAFPVWSTSHFLDAGELVTGIAFGYDWLYEAWTPEQRTTLRTAMVERILRPGLEIHEKRQGPSNFFPTATSNWNCVCNAGLLAGALAIAEDEPELAEAILSHAVPSLAYPMSGYKPDGASEEGPTYWGYGTDFLCLAAVILESATGSAQGIAASPAMDRTCFYRLQVETPNGRNFQYADCWPRSGCTFSYVYLAQTRGPQAARDQVRALMAQGNDAIRHDSSNRLRPLMALWLPLPAEANAPSEPTPLDAQFRGRAEIAIFRSSWEDPRGAYLGFKAGHSMHNHSQLDLGSFLYDAYGVRWSTDLGPDSYGLPGYFRTEENPNNRISPETAHLPHRWTYLRNNNHGHSTLTLGGDLQSRQACAPISQFKSTPDFAFAIAEMDTVYPGRVASWRRGAALVNRISVVIRDEFTGLQPGVSCVWALMTEADVEVNADGRSATLTKDGETLQLRLVQGSIDAMNAAPALPPTPEENQNEGITRLTLSFIAREPNAVLEVHLIPQGAEPPPEDKGALSGW